MFRVTLSMALSLLTLTLTFLLVLPTWDVRPTLAFQCLDQPTLAFPLDEKLADNDAVFVGEVVGIQHVPKSDGSEDFAVKFRLEQYWKGFSETDEYALVKIHFVPGYPVPSIEEDIGKKLLVYADSAEDYEMLVFETFPVCDGTVALEWAVKDISILGPGSIANGRIDVPATYLKEFELDYDVDGVFLTVTGTTVNVVPTRLEIDAGKSVQLDLPAGAYGQTHLTFPRKMIDGIYSINSSVPFSVHFEELSSNESSTTVQVYVPINTDSLKIYGASVIPEFPLHLLILSSTFAFLIGAISLKKSWPQRPS